MGLLDDAIREHLDLKRRRGADPTEIERAEREALGPVRRGPDMTGQEPGSEIDAGIDPGGRLPGATTPEFEAASQAPAEPWEPFDEDPELRALEERDELSPYEPAHAADGDPLMDDEQLSGERRGTVPPHPAEAASTPASEAVPAPHPADPAPPHQDQPFTHVDQETEEYDLEPEHEADDDVLETTPEFLQDAPEHDRLWFEQRPPRDFDFDG
jgi:hypothetical protein